MNRTFHQHVSIQGVLTIVLLAAIALWCFLARVGVSPLVGFVCLLLGAAAVDRLVNTTYVFTSNGKLLITRGRLGEKKEIAVDEIISARPIRGTLFTARHVVIEYGCGKITYAQPSGEREFIDEIRCRQERMERRKKNDEEDNDE